MRKISKRLVGVLLVCVIAMLSVVAMTSCGEDPAPPQRYVVDDPDDYRIVRIVYNSKFAEGEYAPENITGYDSEAVLECLSRYEEFRSENNYAGSNSADVQIEVVVGSDKELKVVLLGNNLSISHEGTDELEYSIANGDALKAELLALIGK